MLDLTLFYILVEFEVGHNLLSLLSINVLITQLWQLGSMLNYAINLLLGLSDLPNLLLTRLFIL